MGWVDDVISRVMEAILAIPVILIGLVVLTNFGTSRYAMVVTVAFIFTPIVFRTVRASTLAEAELDYVTSARLRGEGALVHDDPRDPAQHHRPDRRRDDGARRLRDLHDRHPAVPHRRRRSRLRRSGATRSSRCTRCIPGGTWWPTVFPALALASLVIAVNLIADSVEAVYAS